MLDRISQKFTDIFRNISGKSTISEKNIKDAVDEIKITLLEADVNLRVVRRFINRTVEEATGENVLRSVDPGQQFIKIVYDRLVALLGDSKQDLNLKGPDTHSVILLMGLQGSGKTTTSAKLALRLKNEGRRPLLVAADLIRPAAVKQLQVLGEQIGVEVYSEDSKDAVKVVKNALGYGKKKSFNTIIIDTAGRLHLDNEMMKEIKRISDISKPDETLFVADAMTGQGAVNIAKEFHEKVGISGVILSKFDSDARGGAAISLKSVTGQALKFIGVGEKMEDIEPFYPERIASRILGMGDVVSLVEKAQETIDTEEAEKLQEKMISATFTLQDYLDQFQRVRKMGNIDAVLDMIPGARANVDPGDIDQKEMIKEEAIILSMTMKERYNHRIIGPSRRKRIARGSGTAVFDVNRLLKKFEKTRIMMKKVAKSKKYQANLMKSLGV
jgi:signal recognition particle subunit SRP54